jgi:hypothetical protein
VNLKVEIVTVIMPHYAVLILAVGARLSESRYLSGGRCPSRSDPTRTCVAPAAIACSRS